MNDAVKCSLLVMGMLLAGIIFNAVVLIAKARAEPSDPGAFYRTSVNTNAHSPRRARSHRRYAKRVHRHRTYAHRHRSHHAAKARTHRRYVTVRHVARIPLSKAETQIVSHPSGCPSRLFCGCGVALAVYGKHVRELWLASNWLKFPRAAPAPGMVAARRGHVFQIREVRGPGIVLAYDPNSGQRKTRIHLRRLAGYTVVDPRGRKAS